MSTLNTGTSSPGTPLDVAGLREFRSATGLSPLVWTRGTNLLFNGSNPYNTTAISVYDSDSNGDEGLFSMLVQMPKMIWLLRVTGPSGTALFRVSDLADGGSSYVNFIVTWVGGSNVSWEDIDYAFSFSRLSDTNAPITVGAGETAATMFQSGQTIIDLGCHYNESAHVFLPTLANAVSVSAWFRIQSSRVGQAAKFGIYPYPDDIQGYWGRRFSVGTQLAQFALYPSEAGQSLIVRPLQVNQVQLHLDVITGTIAVGDTVTGGDSGATGEVVFIDTAAKVVQLRSTSGTFLNTEAVSATSGGTSALIHDPIDCTWMWQAEQVCGAFPDLDNGWYQGWY